MAQLRSILRGIDRMSEGAGRFSMYFLLVLMAAIVIEVISRYFLNRPTLWSLDLNEFTMLFISVMSGGYTLILGGHVNVDSLYGRFKPRVQAIISLITWSLGLMFLLILLWKSWEMFARSLEIREHSSSVLAPPLYPFKLIVPVGVFIILLQCLAQFTRFLMTAVTGKEEIREPKPPPTEGK